MTRALVLGRQDVESLLSMPRCIELMEAALASLSRGEVVLPLRPVIRVPDSPNAFAVMPAYSAALRASGAKLITVYPGNHGTTLDSHQGVVTLFDGDNGSLLAIMDAASITAIRTAAVSGVATRLLARKDARVLAILGAGVQARSHLDAMMAVRPFSTVRVWSRTRAHAQAIADRAVATYGVEASVSSDAAGAVRGANVICTVTASREPVLCGEWLDAGAHVNAVGASLPTTRELDTEAVRRARIVVDRRESALNEAGDILIPMREGAIDAGSIVAELGELIIGARRARQSEREITLCKSLGIAVEDLACAHDLRLRAIDTGRGTWIEL